MAFDSNSKVIKYMHPKHLPAGVHNWKLYVMPDCYYGMDLNLPVSFTILKESASQRQVPIRII